MNHLTSDELIDAMDGLLAPDRQPHLATCETCQRELSDLSGVLSEAKQTSVPEPSPFFWQHFSARVSTAIDAEQAAGNWPSWLRWQVLLPLGAVAMIILALMISVPKQDAPDVALHAPLSIVEPDAPSEDGWIMLADLVGDLDVETAAAAGVAVKPGVAELAALEWMTTEEQRELTRLLKAELMRAKS
jgi:hypothetical protein